MIARKIDRYLEDFYKKGRKALLVTGARQTGKTYSIRQMGRRMFENFVEINFVSSPEAAGIFEGARGAEEILFRLSAYVKTGLEKGKTLIFLDEVQACPEAVTQIKALVEEGSYMYALSGSLLGVELNSLRSEPVGYMEVKEMYPLDLEEFLGAIGLPGSVLEKVRGKWEMREEVDKFVHEQLMKAFRLYLVVGGMPEVVQTYLDSNNLRRVVEVQRSILGAYRRDIMKYRGDAKERLYIGEIFDLIAPELNNRNKRFILKSLNEKARFSLYENSFLWLKDAGVALPTYNVEELKVPLILAKTRNLFKLFQSDVGLLTCQLTEGIQLEILECSRAINFGSMYENVVAQELRAHGFELYYYNSKKLGELDFVVERGGKVLPIEVKSGKDYERHNALWNVMTSVELNIESGIVFCNENVQVKGEVTYMPIYMVMFLERGELGDVEYKLDLSGLEG